MVYSHRMGIIEPFVHKFKKQLFFAVAATFVASFASMTLGARAATTVVVTPSEEQGWSTAFTNEGGTVETVIDTSSLGNAALQLSTDGNNPSRAQYMHAEAGTPLSSLTDLSYQTKYISGPNIAAASYQLVLDLNGNEVADGYTVLVYEPYWNGTVDTAGGWQTWDVDASDAQLWSSTSFDDGVECVTQKGSGGPPFYTIEQLAEDCPNAVVNGYGVNVGTYNTNYVVRTDAFQFNDTLYDFERAANTGEITSPVAGSTVSGIVNLTASYEDNTEGDVDGVQWAVRSGTCAAGTGTVAGNVDGFSNPYIWTDSANFSATFDTTTVADGMYCFVFNPVDDAGENNVRVTSQFMVDNPEVLGDKNQCKNGGWVGATADGHDGTFKNQGQCVSHFASNGRSTNARNR